MISRFFLFTALFAFAVSMASAVQAQVTVPENPDEKSVIYERPTYAKLSQLYWALMKFDPKVDRNVDNFLLINECDIYETFYNNEFEWNGIRESTRDFLTKSRKEFPTYFEFMQPLRFAEYDLENSTFEVWNPYKIDGVRRFEILAENIYDTICGYSYGRDIDGYPRGLYAELNRPFTLNKVKVKPEIAQAYIAEKAEELRQSGKNDNMQKTLYESRDAYLLMKIRVFSYKEEHRIQEYNLAKVLAILESYEIYGDRDRKMLLFSENFKRKKKRSALEVEMKKKYQERLKKQMEEKRKAQQKASETP